MEPLGKRLTAGDPAAFAELYDLCAVRCHHYLVARLESRDAADDVLQEVFVRLVRQRAKLDRVENLLAYVFAVARNESIRFAERRGREARQRQPLAAEDLFLEAQSDNPDVRDDAEQAVEALRQLPPDGREVVNLKIYGGLTFREIAELLGLPQGTVATRYRTALAQLKDWFARQPS
jgi:RNA polymerase sigma-70 factor (ECF subfamily)